MITDRLIEKIIATQNPTCVGLDTLFDYLPDEMKAGVNSFEKVAERVFDFNKKTYRHVASVYPVRKSANRLLRNVRRGGYESVRRNA